MKPINTINIINIGTTISLTFNNPFTFDKKTKKQKNARIELPIILLKSNS